MADVRCKTMSMDERKNIIARLVKRFKDHEEFYTSKAFVEAEVRNKFIEPFLEALAWDVKNEKEARPDRLEVICEDRVVIDGRTKHPDYTLCYGGDKKIYIEAKQPSIDLKTNPEPALQVRRYAYSEGKPIAILTDFQEFAIYDTRVKPKPNDTAATARIEYLTYQEYVEKFEKLYDRISWDAVDRGTFDTYWETSREKKGTQTVDKDILQMIEKWRINLAEDIALHNENIDAFSLTSSVQKIIDRVLFLRICEDKEIEKWQTLKNIAETKTDVYKKLKGVFTAANEKFNAGLFATDEHLDSLIIQDKTLITIINDLYFPCPYEFSVIPVEILGSIYERFLGKIIRFTKKTKNGHSIQIIEKPEVKKAGGVFYTPPYIVRYIVQQTIGQKIDGKKPSQVAKMRFVDPACGSGSFLVGAYQYLLDWHLNYYYSDNKNISSYEKDGILYKDAKTQEYKLSIDAKRKILLNNIYGVDIDAQAVEVTKLSLFLKLLENEGHSLDKTGQVQLFRASEMHAKILPDMSKNIKCGNSLIGTDFYTDKDLTLFSVDEQRRINTFDWKREFPFMEFDCVIGNPPYGAVLKKDEEDYLRKKYPHQTYQLDSYLIFTEKLNDLMKNDSLSGFIMPNTWLSNVYSEKMRKFIFETYCVRKLNHYSYFVFKGATVETDIYIFNKNSKKVQKNDIELSIIKSDSQKKVFNIPQKKFIEKKGAPINIFEFTSDSDINKKMEKLPRLGSLVQIVQGAKPFQQGKGKPRQTKQIVDEAPFIQNFKKDETFLPCLRGNLINRYSVLWNNNYYISYGDWLAEPRYSAKFECPEKLLVRQTGDSIIATYDDQQFVARDNLYVIRDDNNKINLKYLLCILNSNFITWYYRTYICPEKGKNLAQVKRTHLAQIPIPTTTIDEQKNIAKLANQIITAYKQFSSAKSISDKKIFEQRIQIINTQINTSVNKLYGLTDDEIKNIEEF